MRCAFGRLAALRLDIEVDRLVVRALKAAAPQARRVLVQAGCCHVLLHVLGV